MLGLLMKNRNKLARSFIVTFCYTDDVLFQNNPRFGAYVDHIYPIQLEIKANTTMFAPYLDIPLQIDSASRLRTKLYDNRHYFIFPIVYSQFICSNIPEASEYVYISQLIRYSTVDCSYQDFI